MDYLSNIKDILVGTGSVGVFIGLLIAWKSGLLTFVWNLKKNGNGHDTTVALATLTASVEAMQTNHLHSLEVIIEDMKRENTEFRRFLEDHSRQEIQLLDKLVMLAEK